MNGKLVRPAVVALAIAGALVAGGIAYATIPDGSGVIHGCYKKTSPNQGTLRVIDTGKAQACTSSESGLSWSQTGPQGPQGPQGTQGPQGPQGAQGPSGSSHAYSDSNLDGLTLLSPNSHTITQLTLPAGDYVVWATGSVVKTGSFNTAGSDNDVKCVLDDPNDNAVTASVAEANGLDYEDAVPYTLVATVSLSTSGTITVDCTTLTGTVVSEVDFNSLVATAVDAVN
ncbi:MAG TPA: hypothetical protein VFV91_06545 [Gaiellaceae bacterium]|jgi:hypothetical protein|nr:hypothetical protein [Gaiellaceae bacterium]